MLDCKIVNNINIKFRRLFRWCLLATEDFDEWIFLDKDVHIHNTTLSNTFFIYFIKFHILFTFNNQYHIFLIHLLHISDASTASNIEQIFSICFYYSQLLYVRNIFSGNYFHFISTKFWIANTYENFISVLHRL